MIDNKVRSKVLGLVLELEERLSTLKEGLGEGILDQEEVLEILADVENLVNTASDVVEYADDPDDLDVDGLEYGDEE